MSSLVTDNNKINELIDSTKCWICLNPLFVPAIIKCNNEDHSSMTNICACLPCCRRALKLNIKKSDRIGNLRLPCGCSINLSTPKGMRNTYMYKKVETMYPILNCLYEEVECPNGCGFKAKSQKSAHEHLRKDCPNSHVKCPMCNFWGKRKDMIKHRIEKHPISSSSSTSSSASANKKQKTTHASAPTADLINQDDIILIDQIRSRLIHPDLLQHAIKVFLADLDLFRRHIRIYAIDFCRLFMFLFFPFMFLILLLGGRMATCTLCILITTDYLWNTFFKFFLY